MANVKIFTTDGKLMWVRLIDSTLMHLRQQGRSVSGQILANTSKRKPHKESYGIDLGFSNANSGDHSAWLLLAC